MTRERSSCLDGSSSAAGTTLEPGVQQAIRSSKIGLLLVLAATYFVYAPATRFAFVYDDIFQIGQNPHLDSWRFLPVYFTQHVWSHVPQIPANFYRPLFLVWLRLNNVLFLREPAGWHFTTILLHIAATALAYLLATTLLKNRPAALVTALLFGLHPVHVEAVAWVSGVPEPLSTVFFLGSFLCYLRQRTEAEHRVLWLSGSLLLFGAALLSKETAAVLPLVMVAYELTAGRDRGPGTELTASRFQRLWKTLLSYFVLLLIYLLVRQRVLGGFTHRMSSVSLHTSVLMWPWLLCFYLREIIWPSHLSPLYDVAYVNRLAQPAFILPLLALCATAAVVFWLSYKSKSGMPIFLSAWFLITLAPAMVIFCVALPAEGFHDRYLYLPSFALALWAGALFSAGWSNPRFAVKGLTLAAVILVSLGLAVSTHVQTKYWASNYVLFQRAVAVAPRNEIANLNFVAELLKTMEYERALRLSQAVIALNPESARALGSAGAASFLLGNYRQSEAFYAKAVQIDPTQANLFRFLGITRMKLGLYEGAQTALQKALAVDPHLRGVHYALGLAEINLQEWQQAKDQFQAELNNDPDNSSARDALRDAEAKLHSPAAAVVLSPVLLSPYTSPRRVSMPEHANCSK